MEQMPKARLDARTYLENFRALMHDKPYAERGSVTPEQAATLAYLKSASETTAEKYFPEVLKRTDSRKVEPQKKAFNHSIVRTVKYIGTVALRNQKKEPILGEFIENTKTQREVLDKIAEESIQAADLLTNEGKFISPRIWESVRMQYMGPERVEKIVDNFLDLGLFAISKVLAGNPVDPEGELTKMQEDIDNFSKIYMDEVPLSVIRYARINLPKKAKEFIEAYDKKSSEHIFMPVVEAMGVKAKSKEEIQKEIEALKQNPVYAERNFPDYVLKRAIESRKGAEDFLSDFITREDELRQKYPDCGIYPIRRALLNHASNPAKFLTAYRKNMQLLATDPDYDFLSYKRKNTLAVGHPYNLEEKLAKEKELFKYVLDQEIYTENIGMLTIRSVFEIYLKPIDHLDRIVLKKKFKKAPEHVAKYAIDTFSDINSRIEFMDKYRKNYNAVILIKRFREFLTTELISYWCVHSENPREKLDQVILDREDLFRKYGSRYSEDFLNTLLKQEDPIQSIRDYEFDKFSAIESMEARTEIKTLLRKIIRGEIDPNSDPALDIPLPQGHLYKSLLSKVPHSKLDSRYSTLDLATLAYSITSYPKDPTQFLDKVLFFKTRRFREAEEKSIIYALENWPEKAAQTLDHIILQARYYQSNPKYNSLTKQEIQSAITANIRDPEEELSKILKKSRSRKIAA